MDNSRAPLLQGGNRQLMVEDADGSGAWVRFKGNWYPTQPRTLQDKQLAALSVLIPCLGVALKYGFKTRKFLLALGLTTLLYFPGLFFALFTILIEPRRPSEDQISAAPFGYVFGTDIPAGDVLDYASLD